MNRLWKTNNRNFKIKINFRGANLNKNQKEPMKMLQKNLNLLEINPFIKILRIIRADPK